MMDTENKVAIYDDFAHKILSAKICDEYYEDMTIFCQSPMFIFEVLENEQLTQEQLPIKTIDYEKEGIDIDYMVETGMWFGWLILSWKVKDEISGQYILDNYNIDAIIQDYDYLHTLSISAAVYIIKDEYKKIAN